MCRDRLLALLCDCEDVADAAAHRYKKIVADMAAMDALLVETFLEAHETPPARIVLDVDATDDTLHGISNSHFGGIVAADGGSAA